MKFGLNHFRTLGRLEGLSLLTLFLIAMPMKYVFHEPQMVRIVGSIHGLLFILYAMAALYLSTELNWPSGKAVKAIIFSCLPFGTFIFEKKYL